MTVAELIRELERVPPEAELVLVPEPRGCVSIVPSPGSRVLLVAETDASSAVVAEYPLDSFAP